MLLAFLASSAGFADPIVALIVLIWLGRVAGSLAKPPPHSVPPRSLPRLPLSHP